MDMTLGTATKPTSGLVTYLALLSQLGASLDTQGWEIPGSVLEKVYLLVV
jgi:hypothetical protein